MQDGARFCTVCGAKAPETPPANTVTCHHCGGQLPADASFCTMCGTRLKAASTPVESVVAAVVSQIADAQQAQETQPLSTEAIPETVSTNTQHSADETVAFPPAPQGETPPTTQPPAKAAPRKRKFLILAILIPVLVLLLSAAGYLGYQVVHARNQCRDLLAEASSLAESGSYRSAASYYEDVLELDADNEEALLGLANLHLRESRFDDAVSALEGLNLSESSAHYATYQKLSQLAQFHPEVDKIDIENFPLVTVTLSCGGTPQLTQESITVSEGGDALSVTDVQLADGSVVLSYEAPDSGYDSENRTMDLVLTVEDFRFALEADYDTPVFLPADIRLMSTDVSQYPTVTAYFRVVDPVTNEALEGLDTKSFIIRERLQGGEYLSREVHAVAPLEGNQGLNIDLVVDKSDSISASDMGKIKNVLTEFVNKLHYDVGDRAEILAFDSIVQQMCAYTGNAELLINGIHNMSTDGMTAFYDAVHDGITSASLQGGARCVIAFTDGVDNRSRYDANQVIHYANQQQVPVYIIGVGSVDTYTLKSVAEATGGRYWYIDDLYDLQEIFDEIYAEQQTLYAVEYLSDEAADAHSARELEVIFSDKGYKAQTSASFTPVQSIPQEERVSRYEIIKEALTWEEANKRCQEMGGHLATITSQSEEEQLIAMAEAAEIDFIWLGGYTSYDDDGNVFGHWVTGEDFVYEAWCVDEPSRVDLDGTEEWYIMLWNIPSLGGWNWNDQRNDPAAEVSSMTDSMGFICEFES